MADIKMQSQIWNHKFSFHCFTILILCFISHKQKHTSENSQQTVLLREMWNFSVQSAPVQNEQGLTIWFSLSQKVSHSATYNQQWSEKSLQSSLVVDYVNIGEVEKLVKCSLRLHFVCVVGEKFSQCIFNRNFLPFCNFLVMREKCSRRWRRFPSTSNCLRALLEFLLPPWIHIEY